MRWSKIVKRHLRGIPEIHPYILEEVEAPQEIDPDALLNEAGAEVCVPARLPSPEPDAGPPPSPYEQGYAVGWSEGKATGFTEGKTQGFSEGKAQGLTEGEWLGKKIREEELQEWERTYQMALRFIGDFKDLSETYVADAEQELLQIAVALAQKIVKKELAQDHEGIIEMVQAALKEIPPAQTLILRVHPQDVEIVTRKKPSLLEAIEGVGFLKIEPDPQLNPGDSLLETEEHIVDARPDVQRDELKKKLLPPGEM